MIPGVLLRFTPGLYAAACYRRLVERIKMADHYHTDEEIEAVVAGFENCTTAKEKFTHLSHLTVAAYYLRTSTPHETFEKMRFGFLRFLDHHGVGPAKYSDRVTWAWIEKIQNVIEQMQPGLSLLAVINAALDCLRDLRIAVARDDQPN